MIVVVGVLKMSFVGLRSSILFLFWVFGCYFIFLWKGAGFCQMLSLYLWDNCFGEDSTDKITFKDFQLLNQPYIPGINLTGHGV
jgi:hypothetical protein